MRGSDLCGDTVSSQSTFQAVQLVVDHLVNLLGPPVERDGHATHELAAHLARRLDHSLLDGCHG